MHKSHCKRGHSLRQVDVYVDKQGSRHCRRCQSMAQSRWLEKKRREGYVQRLVKIETLEPVAAT